MRAGEVYSGSTGNDRVRVQLLVAGEVMHFDMRHVDRGLDARVLEDVFGVVEQGGVLADALAVGLEIHHIHLIEADQRHKEANIRLCDGRACQVSAR